MTTGPEPVARAAEVEAAEARAIAGGISALELMRRAGEGAARAILEAAPPGDVLVLCGPGNNGGDGYVVAQALREAGRGVRIAAFGPPKTETALEAASGWQGPVEPADGAAPAPIFVDALLGTGARPLSGAWAATLDRLTDAAVWNAAIDLPSGMPADGEPEAGRRHGSQVDLVIALGALKPAHMLYPTRAAMMHVVLVDIGLGEFLEGRIFRLGPPDAHPLDPTAHKYRRGAVLVLAGGMPGAALLASRAAQRAGAGYVAVAGNTAPFAPSSLVMRALGDIEAERFGAAVIGCGLGTEADASAAAEAVLAFGMPLVIDGDMFTLFSGNPEALFGRGDIMTPHEGEFQRLFGELNGDKIERALAAAEISGNVVVLKGADTVIAAPDGRAAVNDHAHARLATAGSGDVLAGIIAAERARGRSAFDAACAGVWRHGDAGLRAPDNLIAEDLPRLL